MSDSTIDYDSPLSVALRGGGDVAIWLDHISSGEEIYPLDELTRAAVVSAPVTANVAVVGAGLAPALLLQMYDGRAPLFVPSDPLDTWRLLAAILRLRPDLDEGDEGQGASRPAPLPAPPSTSQGTGNGNASRRTVQPLDIALTDRALAALAHLSVFYMPLLLPFILWLALRGGSPYAARQAKQAFFFHLLILAIVAVVIIPAWVLLVIGGLALTPASDSSGIHAAGATFSISSLVCGGALAITMSVALSVYGVYGAAQAFMGKPFYYPLLRWL